MQHFFLIRHGQSTGQASNCVHDASTPMTAEGRRQVQSLIPFLREMKIMRIYSSPYRRAMESAEILNTELQVPLVAEECFGEWNYHGNFVGSWEQHRAKYPKVHVNSGSFDPGFCVPGGESFTDFYARVQKRTLAFKEVALSDQSPIAIVSHFCALNVVANTLLQLPQLAEFYFDFANGSVSKIAVKNAQTAKLAFSNRTFY